MMVGSDVAEALSIAERQRGEKAFVMGIGYEDGEPVNIGSSYKGRIWAKLEGDLKSFKTWCTQLGKKLVDKSIDPNQILKDTLIPKLIFEIPKIFPVWIDWDIEMYLHNESKFNFSINLTTYNLSSTELVLIEPNSEGKLFFALDFGEKQVNFELQLFENKSNDEPYPDFKIIQNSKDIVTVTYGNQKMLAETFFEKYTPTIWFANGSALTGNEYVELKQSISLYPKDEIITWKWDNVTLSSESQGVYPINTNSIQYRVIQILLTQDFDIIYDDDNPGEIADIVAIKQFEDKLRINLYHIKYAIGGVVSNRIQNLYEVCGQAQKSIHWKHKDGRELFNHLLRRINKKENDNIRPRLEKGSEQNLERLLKIAKKEIPIEFEIFIVQPGLSKDNCTNEILTLLGVTENYIKEVAGINLKVISSQ